MSRGFKLNRRHLLEGVGAAIALPVLDAMIDPKGLFYGKAGAQPAAPPRRMIIYTYANGAMMRSFTPAARGTGWAVTECLSSFAGRQDEINILTGLGALRGVEGIYDEGDINHHPLGASIFLTGGVSPRVEPIGTPSAQEGQTKRVSSAGGLSVDEAAATALRGLTPLSNLTVYTEINDRFTIPTRRYTWTGVDSPGTYFARPKPLFDYLFTGLDLDPDAALRTAELNRSILDAVRESVIDLQGQLGSADRVRLDEHLTALREIEARATGMTAAECTIPRDPGTAYMTAAEIPERTEVMMQLSAMALKCDLTRVLVFSLGETSGGVPFDFMDPTIQDHGVSHWSPGSAEEAHYTQTTTWKISQFARFLEILDAIPEGDGTLVDYSAIVCASEFSDGGRHYPDMLPVLAAGRLGGMAGGRHLVFPCSPGTRVTRLHENLAAFGDGGYTPLANLWLTMLHAIGVDAGSFGLSTSTLSDLWV